MGQANLYGNLGVVLKSLGEYDKAKEYLATKPARTETYELCFSLLVNMRKRKNILRKHLPLDLRLMTKGEKPASMET